MPDYQLGKIYLITSETNKLLYVGSTAQKYISNRITGHIRNYKNGSKKCCSYKLLECDDYNYKLLKEFPCSNVQQLKREEGFWILHYKNQTDYECVNKHIAGRTQKEYTEANRDKIKERRKIYYQENLDKVKEYYQNNKDKIKEYKEENRDKIAEYHKKRRENNKDKLKEQSKIYYENNKDKKKEYQEKNRDKIKERKKEYNKIYRENNRDKILAQQKEYRKSKTH
tara:strand:+ start:103 stop:780 length:678 start_codon:yes stop_codon:yes gene_type:complete